MPKNSSVCRWLLACVFCMPNAAKGPPAKLAASGALSPYQYIAEQRPMPINAAGAPVIPPGVLSTVKKGGLSPIMMFALMLQVMESCHRDIAKRVPPRRAPLKVSMEAFKEGECRMGICFQNALVLSMLWDKKSPSSSTGDSSNQQTAAMMMAGLNKSTDECTKAANSKNGNNQKFDSNLVNATSGGK